MTERQRIIVCKSCRTMADLYGHHGTQAVNKAHKIIACGRVMKDRFNRAAVGCLEGEIEGAA